MKTRLISALSACVFLMLLPAPQTRAQESRTDLSMRRALYFTGTKTDRIDLKSDKYVAENGTMTLKRSDAAKCEEGGCYFNLGFIAFRKSPTGALSTYGLIQAASGLVGNTLYFAPNEATRQGVLQVKLAAGSNKVILQIDPHKKTPEIDESNNNLTVTIIVEGKP